jgi:hypothetical protein
MDTPYNTSDCGGWPCGLLLLVNSWQTGHRKGDAHWRTPWGSTPRGAAVLAAQVTAPSTAGWPKAYNSRPNPKGWPAGGSFAGRLRLLASPDGSGIAAE